MCAISKCNDALAFKLIERGVNVNDKDNEGNTPLMWAARLGNNALAFRLLIDQGEELTVFNPPMLFSDLKVKQQAFMNHTDHSTVPTHSSEASQSIEQPFCESEKFKDALIEAISQKDFGRLG